MHQKMIVAAVWAIERADPAQLRTLGEILSDWRSERSDVDDIHGLDCLLKGVYPSPFGPYHFTTSPTDGAIPIEIPHSVEIEGELKLVQTYIPEPWKDCPAVILGTSLKDSGNEKLGTSPNVSGYKIRESLEIVVPRSLGTVGFDLFLP